LAIEIELKAHIADNELIKSLLFEKADYLYAFKKKTYGFPAGHWHCQGSN